jgi:hypothetical protein
MGRGNVFCGGLVFWVLDRSRGFGIITTTIIITDITITVTTKKGKMVMGMVDTIQ